MTLLSPPTLPMAPPVVTQRGAKWQLHASPQQLTILRAAKIPGLWLPRVGDGCATGLIDAVAAGAQLLKGPLPKPQAEGAFVVKKGTTGLRTYQEVGVDTLLHRLAAYGAALLADDVGCGKTAQAIITARLLGGRVLVIAPAHCRSTWADELAKWHPLATTAALTPITNKKTQAVWDAAPTADIVVTSYEQVQEATAAAFNQRPPTLMIFDEAHYLCGRKTKRSTFLEDYARMVPNRLALSATPLYSRPKDLYKLLRVLFGGGSWGSPSGFDFRYCAGFINQWGGMDNKGVSNADELRLRLSYYMLRREKRDVIDELPAMTRQVVWVDGTEDAKRAFVYAMNEERGEAAVVRALQATLDAKLDATVRLASDAYVAGQPPVIFTYMKVHAHELARRLTNARVPCVTITGEVPAAQRDLIAKQAAAERMAVVATIDSAGTGINSLRDVSSYGIMHSVPWVPAQALQAEGRLHRMGQKGAVNWTYVAMRDSMDEMVVQTVIKKLDAARAVLPAQEEGRNMRDTFGDDAQAVQQALAAIYEGMS